jgi:hypothetical protein
VHAVLTHPDRHVAYDLENFQAHGLIVLDRALATVPADENGDQLDGKLAIISERGLGWSWGFRRGLGRLHKEGGLNDIFSLSRHFLREG